MVSPQAHLFLCLSTAERRSAEVFILFSFRLWLMFLQRYDALSLLAPPKIAMTTDSIIVDVTADATKANQAEPDLGIELESSSEEVNFTKEDLEAEV